MPGPIQAPEILAQSGSNALMAAQRMFNSLTDSINELEQRLRISEKKVQELGYWTSNNDWRQTRISTAGAVETTLAAYTMVNDRVWLMDAVVAARESDGTDRAYYHIEGLFYREGVLAVQEGLTISSVNLESDIVWNCDFDVNGADVRIRVTGDAATDVDWRSWARFREYSV